MRLFKRKEKLSIEEKFKKISEEVKETGIEIKKTAFIAEELSKIFELSISQVALLSIVISNDEGYIDKKDLKKITKVSSYDDIGEQLSSLWKRNFIFFHSGYPTGFYVPSNTSRKRIMSGEKPETVKEDNLTELELFLAILEYIDRFSNDQGKYVDSDFCYETIIRILRKNKTSSLYQGLLGTQNLFNLVRDDFLILMYFCSARVEGYHRISFDCLGNIYSTQKDKKNNEIAFLYGEHLLFKMGIIEEAGTDFRGRNSYTLTDKYEKILLSGIKLKKKYHSIDNFLKNPEDIYEKELYYPREIQEKVSELLDFFNIEKYKGIRERLRDSGLQTGFTCLFYGDPGTGKTETVYQIAKRTGRPIFSIDMSTIRSKWVGDSEKILASYFERYQNYIESHEVEPILLFNEADAIIGKRLENILGSVDKMENTLQNILLQKMEDFDGILIATTNLQGNLDRAFDRRFLYKIKFSKPTPEIRSRLWINKVSGINETLASRLSQEYDLSGGQIDNISRKHMISRVLYGDRDITYEELKGYCDEEVIESRQKIGF